MLGCTFFISVADVASQHIVCNITSHLMPNKILFNPLNGFIFSQVTSYFIIMTMLQISFFNFSGTTKHSTLSILSKYATWPYIENEDDLDTTKPYGENEGLTFNNWLPEYSSMELRQMQEEDNDISPIIQWLETGDDPSLATLRLSTPATIHLALENYLI
jgi:hypothetical protein